VDSIVSELLDFAAHYHANLHQDEFGPTRAERTAALRTLLHDLDAVISHLEDLPGDLRSKLSQDFAPEIDSILCWSACPTLRQCLCASWCSLHTLRPKIMNSRFGFRQGWRWQAIAFGLTVADYAEA
jgi:hypothetical protein